MSFDPQQELSVTSYDELKTENSNPITQISSRYDLLGQVLTVTDTASSGSNAVIDNKFTCKTGVASDGLASILTLRQISARPGQGLIARFDAIFTLGVENSQQAAGLITSENSYVFAFLGETFGVAHTHSGVSETQELTITTPASGAEIAVINVNGIAFNVNLTSGTVQHNAFEIAISLQSQVENYNFTSNNDQVVAQALLSGTQLSFTFTSATAVASWVQEHAGVAVTVVFTPQDEWSEDNRLTGTVEEILDPTKGNFYQIQVSSNFGVVRFFVDDNKTGFPVLVHMITNANLSTTTNVTNPTWRLGWFTQNLGSTIDLTCSGSEAGAFIEGNSRRNNPPNSDSNNQLSVGTTLTNIMTFRNRIHFGGKVNRVEIFPQFVSVSSQANKSTFFKFLINPTFSGDLDFFYIDKDNSVMEAAIDSVSVTGGEEIASLTISPNGGETLMFNERFDQDVVILPGVIFAIVAEAASGAGGDMQQSFSWQEDIL